jgi:O-antigen ligase
MSELAFGYARHRPLAGRLQLALGSLALAFVLLSVLPYGGVLPVTWTFLAGAILLLFLGQIALDLRDPPGHATRRLAVPAMLYGLALLWGLLQIWPGAVPQAADPAWSRVPGAAPRVSADPVNGAHMLLRLTAYAMVFWIVARTAERTTGASLMLITIALFSTVLAALGIYWAWIGENPVLGDSATALVTATFVNRNSYATYALIGLVANVALYVERSTQGAPAPEGSLQRLRDFLERFFRGNWVFAIGALLCLSAVLLTESRAGTVSALLALGALALAFAADRRIRNAWVLASAAAIVVFAGVVLSAGVGGRLIVTGPDEMRFAVYGQVAEAIADRPLAGFGIGSFEDSFRQYLTADQAAAEWDMAHNSYLENLFELGLIGALPFYGALLWIAGVVTRGVLTRRRNRVFACCAFGCLVGAGFHALFDFSLQMPATAALFAAIVAIGWSQSFPSGEAAGGVTRPAAACAQPLFSSRRRGTRAGER